MTVARTHLSLNVTEIDRSVAFYRALFGAEPHKRRPGYANFDLENPPLKLALQEGEVHRGGNLNHLGVLVQDVAEVEAARKRFIEAGLATFDEREVECCYAKQDKVWVTDPDGAAWEIYTILDDQMDENQESCCGEDPAADCCDTTAGACCR